MYPSTDEPSLVVSLGTGSAYVEDKPRLSPTRGIFRDGFIPRLFRAFMLSMSSTDGHKFRSRQRQGRKEQYFRFDIEFTGPEPALDDTTRMQELKSAARTALRGSQALKRLARCIVAELFLFELEYRPYKVQGKYVCSGRILCRLRATHPALAVLIQQLSQTSSEMIVQNQALEGYIGDASWLDQSGNFSKRVEIEVIDRRTPITIQLRQRVTDSVSISGSPFTLDSLVSAQQLDACFGNLDHKKRKRTDSTDLQSRKRARHNSR